MYFEKSDFPAEQRNPATLAYVGDAVFELLVRERLLQGHPESTGPLHKRAAKLCSAVGQAAAAEAMLPLLTEGELRQFKRGRNAALAVAKRKNPTVHCAASGLETLFGLLYLEGRKARLLELFEVAWQLLGEEETAG
ncbi:MAG: cysteine--tRNA ligase [Clostridia bacterium]|nr:cysteine--tRNA ligase [Clostridia bacterium]